MDRVKRNVFSIISDGRNAEREYKSDPIRLEALSQEMRSLLQKNPDAKEYRLHSDYPDTPLIMAASHALTPILRTLLEFGADIHARGKYGYTALHSAVYYVKFDQNNKNVSQDAVRLLLEKGASPNLGDNHGQVPLVLVVRNPWSDGWRHDKALFDLLIEYGADPLVRDKAGNTLLHHIYENPLIFDALLKMGLDINARNHQGETPIVRAAIEGRPSKTLKLMIAAGADLDVKDSEGYTLLHLIARDTENDNASALRALIRLGADVNARDNEGLTPLHWAAGAHYEKVITALLKSGADPTLRDNQGRTPEDVVLTGEYWGTFAHYAPDDMGDPEFFTRGQKKIARILHKAVEAVHVATSA